MKRSTSNTLQQKIFQADCQSFGLPTPIPEYRLGCVSFVFLKNKFSMAKSGEHLKVKCIVCDSEFRQSRSDQVYCGRKCFYSVWKLKLGRFHWKKPTECNVCKNSFIPETPNQKYCNKKCAYEKRLVDLRNGKGNGWSKGMTFVEKKMTKCKECGSDFFPQSAIKKGERTTAFFAVKVVG